MFTPHSVTWCYIVDTGKELEVLERNLLRLDA